MDSSESSWRASRGSQTAPQGTKAKPIQGKRNLNNFSIAFWNTLPEVVVSVRALRELDRRNDCKPLMRRTICQPSDLPRDLCRFSRLGGPSLEQLRGYQYKPPIASSSLADMPRRKKTKPLANRKITPGDAQPKAPPTITPYDPNFQRILSLGGVHEPDYEAKKLSPVVPTNFEEIGVALSAPRKSTPTAVDHQRFRRALKHANESKLTGLILKWLIFGTDASYAQDAPFSNLSQIVIPDEDLNLSDARPDYYEGSPCQDIDRRALQDLSSVLVPSHHDPALPNFFLEFKSFGGSRPVAERQIVYDGALGARAIDSLYNYKRDKRLNDGKARVLGFTFDGGLLRAYTHHVEPSASDPSHLEHFTAEVDCWGMTANPRTFGHGVNALRNGRELAEKWREEVIKDVEDRLGGR